MTTSILEEVFKPFPENPILSPETWSGERLINAVFNAGATIYKGETLLLVRVETRDGLSCLYEARSKDGRRDWKIKEEPVLGSNRSDKDDFGAEDARITSLPELGTYLISYVHHYYDEIYGDTFRVYLMRTADFENLEHLGPIFLPGNKDTVIFPKMFDGRYVAICRPIINGKANIWISFSPDLKHWGDDKLLLATRLGRWDSVRVGATTPPIEIPGKGWLFSYHGVRRDNYYIGFALLDLEKPWVVIHRTEEWLLGPRHGYMRSRGDYPGAFFCCGDVWDMKRDEYRLYCGVADKELFLYIAKMSDLMNYLLSCSAF